MDPADVINPTSTRDAALAECSHTDSGYGPGRY